jgi:hypothetical protein
MISLSRNHIRSSEGVLRLGGELTPVEMSLISGIGGSTCRSQPLQHPLKFYLLQARATDDEAARLAASPPD